MKKYFVFFATIVLAFSFELISLPQQVSANPKGALCGIEFDTAGNPTNHGQCDPPLVCEKEEPGNNLNGLLRCYEKRDVTCTCNPNNAAQAGRNGFTCTGGPSGFCNVDTEYCVPGGAAEYPAIRDAVDVNGRTFYKLNGISCVPDRRVAPGERCEGMQCQSPVEGKEYECQLNTGVFGPDGAPAIEYRCLEKGNAPDCPAKGQDCSNFFPQSRGCCDVDADGTTKLACDINTNKCVVQSEISCPVDRKSSPACHECAKENEECGLGADGRTGFVGEGCCMATNANQTLSCVDGNNVLIDQSQQKGTCKFRDNSAPPPGSVDNPPIPSPPPPPCAQMAAGVCNAFMTAFGEIRTDTGGFILRIFAILLAVSGGIALLLIMRAGYILMTSAGNPEKTKNGREQLVAAIVGLLFIIFAFVIIQVIAVDILRVPGATG